MPDDQIESGNNLRRPSSAGSLQSDREERTNVQRRVSSAGRFVSPLFVLRQQILCLVTSLRLLYLIK